MPEPSRTPSGHYLACPSCAVELDAEHVCPKCDETQLPPCERCGKQHHDVERSQCESCTRLVCGSCVSEDRALCKSCLDAQWLGTERSPGVGRAFERAGR